MSKVRNRLLTGNYTVNKLGEIEPMDWIGYVEKLEREIERLEELDVVDNLNYVICDEYREGINMDCANCGKPKYMHLH